MRNPSENQWETERPSWLKSVLSVRSNLARVFAVIGIGAASFIGCESEMPVVKKLREKTRERMELKQKYGIDPCEVFGEIRDQRSWDKLMCPGEMPKKKEHENDKSNAPRPPSDIDQDDEGEIRHAEKGKGKRGRKKGYKVVPDSTPKKRINRSQIKPLSPAIQNCIDIKDCRIASRPQGFHRRG